MVATQRLSHSSGSSSVRRSAMPAVAIMLALCSSSAVAQDRPAGTTSAVNVNTTGTPPSQPSRVLSMGINVFEQERVQTDLTGQAQMLFRDGSTLSLGPSSDIVLDKYVYDPEAGAGQLAATASAGLLRFVGGRISKETPVVIKTPVGEVAVRGGVMLLSVDRGTGATSATLLYGKLLTLTGTNGIAQTINRPGFTSSIAGKGEAPSAPTRVTAATLQQMTRLEGKKGVTGGASTQPNTAQVASAPLGSTLTTQAIETALQANVQQQAARALPPFISQTQNIVNQTTETRATTDAAPQVQTNAVLTDAQIAAALGLHPGPPSFLAFNVQNDPALNSTIPFKINQNVATSHAIVSPLLMVLPTGTFVTGGVPSAMQVSLDIEGTGINQSSGVSLATGEVERLSSPTTSTRPRYFAGRFGGTDRFASTFDPTDVGASLTSNNTPSGGSPLSATGTNGFTIGANRTFFGVTSPNTAFAFQFAPNSGPSEVQTANYTFTNTATPTTVPTGVGLQRTSQLLAGYAAGFNNVGTQPFPNFTRLDNYFMETPDVPGGALVLTDAASARVFAAIGLAASARVLNNQNTATLQLFYGGDFGNFNQGQSFIDDHNFAASAAVLTSPNAATVQLSSVNGTAVTNTFGQYFFTGTTALPTNVLPAGVSFCSCQFVQWGFFGGETESGPNNRFDIIHLGTWVAGPLPDPATIPQTGSATYTGHVIGTVALGPPGLGFNAYIAAGGFQTSYNFASRSGAVQVTSFDGANFSGTVNSANFRDFGGALTSTVAGRSGRLAGSFFTGGGDPVAEMGGKFLVSSVSNTYNAAGIFAARKH
jgi:hypothetical protein